MARILETTFGHKIQIAKIQHLLSQGRFPQSMVFAGPAGVGKKRIALAVAQNLVCESADPACGHCGPCLRVEKMQSESLLLVSPEGETGKRPSIKVEAVRELLEKLSLASVGKARIVIIDGANTMNDQASNAFLKTLEEPTENLYFILIVNEIKSLLPTIQSRVQVMRFDSLSADHLKTIKPNLPDWAYRSARGSVDKLVQLTGKEGLSDRTEALKIFDDFCFNDEFLLHDYGREEVKKDRNWSLFILKTWLQVVRDATVLKADGAKFVLNSDQTDLLKKMATSLSHKKLTGLSQELLRAYRDISSNQESSIVIDSLWVKYARMD